MIGRVDYQPTTNTSIYGTYSFDNTNSSSPDVFNQKLVGSESRDQRVTLSLQHSFDPMLLNTITAGFSRAAETGNIDEPGSSSVPAYSNTSLGFLPGQNPGNITVTGILGAPGGIGASGGGLGWWTDPQLSDHVDWVKGRNDIRIGFSVEAIRDSFDFTVNPLGNWSFGSIQNLLTDVPSEFQSAVPGFGTYRRVVEKVFGLYIQDDFRLRSNLTLNFGLRYEPTTTMREVNGEAATLHSLTDPTVYTGNPLYRNPTLGDVVPRVGLAWDPTGSGKNSIRAGFGIFNVLPLPNLLAENLNHTVPFNQNAAVLNPPASSFPNAILPLLAGGVGTANYFGQDSSLAYNLQWNLNVQRQITSGMSVTVGYVGSRGVHLPLHFQDVDVVPPSRATIAPNGNLQFPTTGAIQLIDPSPAFNTALGMLWNGWSIYHSLQVNVSQRFSHGISFQGAYVWSKSIDIGSSEIDGAENQNEDPNPYFFLPNYNRGVSDWDIPQHLSLNFVWDVPSPKLKAPVPRFLASGWELGGIFTVQSGQPFSVEISTDQARIGNTSPHERPNYNAAGCSSGQVNPGNPDVYINLNCFSYPALGQLGNLGRNTLRSPDLQEFDFSVFKNHNLIGRE